MYEVRMNVVYKVIDLFDLKDEVVGETTDEEEAKMLVASGIEGHARFIEVYENGVKVLEYGYREF